MILEESVAVKHDPSPLPKQVVQSESQEEHVWLSTNSFEAQCGTTQVALAAPRSIEQDADSAEHIAIRQYYKQIEQIPYKF